MDTTEYKIGSRIREARIAAGMSQVELADRIGTTGSAVSQWESYKREPQARFLRRLADVLKVSTDWLLDTDAE